MSASRPNLSQAAKRLTATLQQETALARTGGLPRLAAAAEAKREAFLGFEQACAARDPSIAPTASECAALRALLSAADESALVLEAVNATLDRFAKGLRETARSMADCGTYQRAGRPARHVLPVQLDAAV